LAITVVDNAWGKIMTKLNVQEHCFKKEKCMPALEPR
jgi:hypothetical protein